MGEGEILRLWANVWLSPAVLPEEGPGAGWIYGVHPGRFLPGSIRPGARVGPLHPSPLGAETSRADRLEEVRVFSGTAGTCRATVRNPGALRGRLGAGVVAYVPRYGAYVTLSRAPRETALFPVHCCHSSLPGRYASAAYTPVCGGTTGNMPRIPGGGFLECCAMLRAGLVALRRFGVSVWFALVRFRGDLPAFGEFSKACNRHPGFTVLRFGVTCRPSRIVPRWHGMTYREYAAMRRYASVRGVRYGSLWFGSPGVGSASLRVTFSGRWRNRA
jgi:hypothetical protein